MQKRFEIVEIRTNIVDVNGTPCPNVFMVKDNLGKKYGMPIKAVSMYLTEEHAKLIEDILNDEWNGFIANPY